ncbi:MAG: type II secretion system protein [Alphaproteobacteria bacterium]
MVLCNVSLQNILKQEHGFTLIDATVALLVIGILAAPLVQQYRSWLITSQRDLTVDRAQTAREAVDDYYFAFNRYPCPADPTLGPSDADYGMELRDFGGTEQCDTSAAALGPFTVDSKRDADGIGGVDPVYMGMLPFKTLGLTPKQALDAWNNKLTYAVSGLLTDENTYNGTYGGIELLENFVLRNPFALNPANLNVPDGVCTDVALLGVGMVPPGQEYNPVGNAHYAILSHGRDGNGAYYHINNPAPAKVCDMAAVDAENCNNIVNNEATFLYDTCQSSGADGGNRYDDLFVANNIMINSLPFANWNPGADQQDAGAPVGYYGINNNAPEAELDIVGNLRADLDPSDTDEMGRLHSYEYCDVSGGNCMRPEAITGTKPDMRCNIANTAMKGVAKNQVRCSFTVNNLTPTACPSGQFVTGFTSSGGVCCNNVCP